MDIDLQVNGVPFKLGDPLNHAKLVSAQCSRAGFLDRLQLKPPKNDLVYWAKNCEITCFGGGPNRSLLERVNGFSLKADLETTHGTEAIYGTSAYIFFSGETIQSVKFQVLMNQGVATAAVAQFTGLCQREYGAANGGAGAGWTTMRSFCVLRTTTTRCLSGKRSGMLSTMGRSADVLQCST